MALDVEAGSEQHAHVVAARLTAECRAYALEDIGRYESEMLEHMHSHHADILQTIASTGKFEKDVEAKLIAALDEFANIFQASKTGEWEMRWLSPTSETSADREAQLVALIDQRASQTEQRLSREVAAVSEDAEMGYRLLRGDIDRIYNSDVALATR